MNFLNYSFNDLRYQLESINWKEHVNRLNNSYINHTEYINDHVKEWPLMKSIDETLKISIGYLVLVLILSILMKFLNEIKLKFLVFCYNLFMIGLNVFIITKIISIKYNANDFGICSTIHSRNKIFLDKMNEILWWFYISKGLELLNTIFLVLRKKFHKINFLHIYSHSTMFPIWWICTAYFSNGAIANEALMNSLLHVIMHFYYAVSLFGSSLQKLIWWKRYIIQLQMLKFCLLILYCSLLLKDVCENKLNDNVIWLTVYYSLTHVVLIYNFYTKSYYRIMNASLDKSKKDLLDSTPSNDTLNNDQLDFTIKATKRRPLRD